MPASYIPPTDSGFDLWIVNFSTLATATPTAYGLTAPQAVTLAALVATWEAAYLLATTPSTRTKPSVADKDNARFAAEAEARAMAMIVQAWPLITPVLLADLGLTVRDTTPTPIPAPVTVPLLSIVGASNLAMTLRYADELTPAARRKPFGSTQLQLWRYVGALAATGPEQCGFIGAVTKNPVEVTFLTPDAGLLATFYGRWQTRSGLVGPWSLPVTMSVAAGTA